MREREAHGKGLWKRVALHRLLVCWFMTLLCVWTRKIEDLDGRVYLVAVEVGDESRSFYASTSPGYRSEVALIANSEDCLVGAMQFYRCLCVCSSEAKDWTDQK